MIDMSPLSVFESGEVKERTHSPASEKREDGRDGEAPFTIDESIFKQMLAGGQPLSTEVTVQNIEGGAELSTQFELTAHDEEGTLSSALHSSVDNGETGVDMVGELESHGDLKGKIPNSLKLLEEGGHGRKGGEIFNVEGEDEVSEEGGVHKLPQERGEEKLPFEGFGKALGVEQKPSAANHISLQGAKESRNDDVIGKEEERYIDEDIIENGSGDGEDGQRSEALPTNSQRNGSREGGGNGQHYNGLEKAPAVEPSLLGQDFEISSDEQTGDVKEVSTVSRKGGAVTTSHTLGRMVIDQVGSKIGLFFRDGIGKASISLDPPSLGRLQIEIVIRESVVRAQIAAEHQTVKEVVEQNLATLKDALTKQGLYVDEISVSLGEGGSDRRDGMEWGESREMEAGVGANYKPAEGEVVTPARGLSIHQETTGVDIYV